MAKRIKKKESEKLSDSNIKYVIELLEAEKPITKKEACEILRISYNTTRLNNIIEKYREDLAYTSKRKKEKRGRPADNSEIAYIVESYLQDHTVGEISKRVYRSVPFVKEIINRVGVPSRPAGEDKHATSLLPDACISEDFSPGEVAWSAIHHRPCEVRKELGTKYANNYGTSCYQVWIREEVNIKEGKDYFIASNSGGYNAFLAAYDLGKLSHLAEYGVNVSKL